MNEYVIFTDATSDLNSELIEGLPELRTLPMEILLDETPYLYGPGGNIDHAAQMLGLQKVRAVGEDGEVACLRIGSLPEPLSLKDLGILIMKKWDLPYVRLAESSGSENRLHTSIALITGSGMDFANLAVKNGATVLVTGDISYHRADDAGRQGLSLIEASHFLTDRLSTIWLKEDLERMAAEAGCELIVQIAEERDVFRLVTR